MVKFVDLGVLYFSLVLPREPTWVPGGPVWTLRALGGHWLVVPDFGSGLALGTLSRIYIDTKY